VTTEPMDVAAYDRIVEQYPVMWPRWVPGYALILQAMHDAALAMPHPPSTLLDVGCGPGTATSAVAPACKPGASVVLVDAAPGMLRSARLRVPLTVRDAVAGDVTSPEVGAGVLTPDRYDLVLCSFALSHLADQDKRQFLERVAVALAPGGLLMLADEVATDRPAGWDLVERIRARGREDHTIAGRLDSRFAEELTSLTWLPARVDDLTSWLARAGLAVGCPVSVLGSALLVALKPD
jgi:tRNA (cmo5U34)-methyltransferase